MSIFYQREHSEGRNNYEWGKNDYNLVHDWQEIDSFIIFMDID